MTTILQKDGEILENKISSIYDFFQLMKPKVMSLVIFTALIGYFCGVFSSEIILNPYLSMIGILAIALGALAAWMRRIASPIIKKLLSDFRNKNVSKKDEVKFPEK